VRPVGWLDSSPIDRNNSGSLESNVDTQNCRYRSGGFGEVKLLVHGYAEQRRSSKIDESIAPWHDRRPISQNVAMDDAIKDRIRELMFFVVPDPDEEITDEVLEKSEAVGYDEGEQMKAEFRSLIESLADHPEVRQAVLESLDNMAASGAEAQGDDVEWRNVCDVMGRRIRRVLEPIL